MPSPGPQRPFGPTFPKMFLTGLVLLALCGMPLTVLFYDGPRVFEEEKRNIAELALPENKVSRQALAKFFQSFDNWFADRIGPRAELIFLSRLAGEFFKIDMMPGKVYYGRNDWLFLGNDYDRTVDVLEGTARYDAATIERQADFFASLRDAARSLGADFFMLIGPNKSSVYPEHLPPHVFPAKDRAITPLMKSLQARDVQVYDPTDLFLASKDSGLLYWRSDTHWNQLGISLALEGFFAQTGRNWKLPAFHLEPGPVHRGDLVNIGGYRFFPLKPGDNWVPRWEEETPAPPHDKTVLVIGDSFSEGIMPWLERMFGKVTRIHYYKAFAHKRDAETLLAYLETLDEKPDILFWVQVERGFVRYLP